MIEKRGLRRSWALCRERKYGRIWPQDTGTWRPRRSRRNSRSSVMRRVGPRSVQERPTWSCLQMTEDMEISHILGSLARGATTAVSCPIIPRLCPRSKDFWAPPGSPLGCGSAGLRATPYSCAKTGRGFQWSLIRLDISSHAEPPPWAALHHFV